MRNLECVTSSQMKVKHSLKHMICPRAFRVILFFVILAAYLPESVTSWRNIRKLVDLSEESCERSCASAIQCSRWSFYPTGQIDDSGRRLENFCFLESRLMIEMEKKLPAIVDSEKSTYKISGLKSLGAARGFVGIQNLLTGPVAFDSTTLLNFPQNFVRGCSYTISLWVWMWKPNRIQNNIANQKREERIIFSAKHVDSNFVSPEYDTLLPAIIYNVRSKPGKFFFCAGRDENGDYSGFSPPFDIRYHEWMHIALTTTNDDTSAYLNGKYYSVSRSIPPKKTQQKCPYYSYTKGDLSDEGGTFSNESIKIVKDSTAFNTVLEVAGGQGFPSDSGMIQDLTVVRGLALSEGHIQELMNLRKPSIPPTLRKLMRLYGLYSLENYCVLDWEDNYYRMVEWGVCPTQVCGPVCFEEKFLLGLTDGNVRHNRRNALREGDRVPHYFDQLLDDLYMDDYEEGAQDSSSYPGIGLGESHHFGQQSDGGEFSDGGLGGYDEGYDNYDSYYDEAGNLKPLTAEQKELLASYGYDTSDDYYGGYGDGLADGAGYGIDDYNDGPFRGDFAAIRPPSKDKKAGKRNKNMVTNTKMNTKTKPMHNEQSRKAPHMEGSHDGSSSNTFAGPKIKVQKSGRIKTVKDDLISENKNKPENLTQIPPAIVLPRRRSFRKMTKINKNRDFSSQKSPFAERDPGSFSDRFHFMDWVTPAAVMNFLGNSYNSFLNSQKEKTAGSDESPGTDEKMNKEDIEIDKEMIKKLNLLDAEEEMYLLHHPVGRVQALYDAAMIWLNGRHEQFAADLSSDALSSESEVFWIQYRDRAVERATSALTLGTYTSPRVRDFIQ